MPIGLAELQSIVAAGEGPSLEFKRSTGELRESMEALCGMLNAGGRGCVVFGVTDRGEVLGQIVADTTQREIANASRRIEPAVEVRTTIVEAGGGKSMVVVEAEARSAAGPFTFDGRPYLRVGNTTQRMSHGEFDHRVVQRLKGEHAWDRWIAPRWRVGNLDHDEVHRTVEDAVAAKRLTGVLGESVDVVLRRLELVTDEGVTRAAAILFGKGESPRYPMGGVRLARFRGVTKDEFRDNRQFDGHAFALLQHAERFLDEHVPVASSFIEGKMRRVDTPLYPPLAVREALVNALVHRDYAIDGGAVSVALFDDRLEIWSTGLLPAGLTPDALKGTHGSHPRNPLVAQVFHRRGLIERWGRGTNKILDEARRGGCPEPEFEEIAGSFIVRFRPTPQPPSARTERDITPRQRAILTLLRASTGALALREIHARVGAGATERQLRGDLARLKVLGLALPAGRGRGAGWSPR